MCLSTGFRIVCLSIAVHSLCCATDVAKADEQSGGESGQHSTEPVTVARVAAVLNMADLPRPQDASSLYATSSSLHFQTATKPDVALIGISDELLKRGFEAGESFPTRWATITVTIDNRPATIYLENSIDEKRTHVTIHHHQGIDVSNVPRLPTDEPIDQRVDELYYTTPIGVREGQSILRAKISEANLEIQRTSTSNGTAKTFTKDGVSFVCKIERASQQEFEYPNESEPNSTRVYLATHGNVDAASLPRPDDFQTRVQANSSLLGSYKYLTDAKPNDAVKRAVAELKQAGWTPVDAVREAVADSHQLLVSNGTLVQVGAKAYGSGRTHVDFYVSMLSFDLPPDLDKRLIRVDSASKNLFFTTSADVPTVTEFYLGHLNELGWQKVKVGAIDKAKQYRQIFKLGKEEHVVLNVQSRGPDTTWMELAPIDLESPRLAEDSSADPTDSPPASAQAQTALDPAAAAAAEELRSQLSDQGLAVNPEAMLALAERQLESALDNVPAEQAAQIRAMVKESFGVANLADSDADPQGPTDAEPTEAEPIRGNRAEDELAEMRPDAEGQQAVDHEVPADRLAAAEFPLPEGAEEVTRDFEMITFGLPSIVDNAKSIQKSMATLGWKPRGEQTLEDDFAYLKYQKGTGTINVSLVLDDRRQPPVHVVVQGDGLWFPPTDEFGDVAGGFDEEMEADGPVEFPSEGLADDDDFNDSPAEFEGLALPPGTESQVNMSSQFRKETTTSIESDLKSMVAFFRDAASDAKWKSVDEQVGDEKASLAFVGDPGEMEINLIKYDGEVEIHIAIRDTELAKEQGFLPKAGLAKLMLANASEAKVVVVINGRSYKLEPEQGAMDPSKAIHLNVRPGRYNYTIQGAGREEQSDKLSIVVGGTWAVMILPEQGHMAEQMY